jgi:hypothetical protein
MCVASPRICGLVQVGGYGEEFQLLTDVVDATKHNVRFYLELFLSRCRIVHHTSWVEAKFTRLQFATLKHGESSTPSLKLNF